MQMKSCDGEPTDSRFTVSLY